MNDLISRLSQAVATSRSKSHVRLKHETVAEIIDALEGVLPAASQPEAGPVAWHTDDHLADRSATTWDKNVAERWKAKGWPVTPLYTHPTPAPVVPAEGLERAREDEAKAGWTLDMELLKELRSAGGDWGYSLDLEAVEAIALEVEKRLRAQQPAAPVSGVTVQEAARVLLTRLQYSSEADFLDAMQQVMPTEQTADLYAGLTAALSALEGSDG